jgi:radial spoke head protein 4A
LKFKDPQNDSELNAACGERAVSERDAWVLRSKNLLNEVNDLISSSDRALLT